MAKTRRQKHGTMRRRGRKGTRCVGGIRGLFRFLKGSPVKPDHSFDEIVEDNPVPVHPTQYNPNPWWFEQDPAVPKDDTNSWWKDNSKAYINDFFHCKKSNMFTRHTKKGICAKVSMHGLEYDPSAYVLMSGTLKDKLVDLIEERLLSILKEELQRKGQSPRMRDYLFNYFTNKQDSMIQRAKDDFYVKTQSDKQSLIDKRKNKNMIPRSNSYSVVFPASLYLTKEDDVKLREAETRMVRALKEEHDKLQQKQNEQRNPVNNYTVSKKQDEEEEEIYSIG